jgi:hypothetical protein
MLDTLHGAGVEIMSPMYVATRNRDTEMSVPAITQASEISDDSENGGEHQIFDKAEVASAIEAHRAGIEECEAMIIELQSQKGSPGVEADSVLREIEACENEIVRHVREIEDLEEMLRAK